MISARLALGMGRRTKLAGAARLAGALRLVFLLAAILAATFALNPYEELGVSSRASAEQIKKAYRKLAREWHPDRNRAKGANDKFMRINEAYETLTDAEKRAEYDQSGRSAGQSQGGGGGGGGGGFHEFFQQGFGGGFHGFGGFRFDGGQQRQNNAKDRVTMQKFLDDIEGGGKGGESESSSFSKPYLFFVTGTMCFMCMQLEPIWEQAAAELKGASYGVGRVLGDADQALARRLGVRQLPEIVAFVNGEAVSMKVSRYDVRGILDFANDALSTVSSAPSSSSSPAFSDVRVLESSSAFDAFVSGWRADNLVRTLFIGPRTTLRFSVPCFALRKRHLCAFVHSSQPWILDKGIYSHLASERLVVLLEDAKSPAASVTANRISVETIRQTMRDNQWLLLPRLSSQTVLDELCPVTSSSSSSSDKRRRNNNNDNDNNDDDDKRKTFCVVLLTRRDDPRGRRSVESFRKFARDFKQNHSHHNHHHHVGGTAPNVNFAYLFKTTQGAFFEALEKRRQPPTFGKDDDGDADAEGVEDDASKKGEEEEEVEKRSSSARVDVDPIALLWRNSADGLRFSWAPRGWASLPAVDDGDDAVVSGSKPSSVDAAAAAAAAAATAKREGKKLVRQSQNSLSAFIAQILSTPSHELHQHFIAASSIPRLWDEHQGNLLVRGWKYFRAALSSLGTIVRIFVSYLLGSEDVWFSYFTLFLTLSMIYLASYVISSFMDGTPDADRKKRRPPDSKSNRANANSTASSKSDASSSSSWGKKRHQQQQQKQQPRDHHQRRGGSPSSTKGASSRHHAILDGTPIQPLHPDLYDRYVLEARGLGVRVLVLVVPHGLYGDRVAPRQGWWAYPSAAALLKRNSPNDGATPIHVKLATQYQRLTEPLLRQDRRLVLTIADQLLHADWLHDLIDPVLDTNGIPIPELPPVGLCLALHGARRYFSLYWPPEEEEEEEEGGAAFLGLDDASQKGRKGLDQQTFGAWLERLMDGQLPRLHVESWPEDLAIEEKGGEEEQPEERD